MNPLIFRAILISYFFLLIYGWFLLPGRINTSSNTQRVFLRPGQTTRSIITRAWYATKDQEHLRVSFYWNVLGNIAYFLPLGFLLPWKVKRLRRLWPLAVFALLFSLTAETLQYVFVVGFFDIDDVLLNTTGAILGWTGFRFWFLDKFRDL